MAREIPDRFLVAFSFAGEQRDLVYSVAKSVEDTLGEGTVFFDEWFEHYIAGHDADTKLQEIYAGRSELVVVCISERYGNKPWTQMEHEAVRALLMKVRASEDVREQLRILPLRVGDGDVKGINFNTISPDIRKKGAGQTAELIENRLKLILPDLDKLTGKAKARVVPRRIFLAECTGDMDEKRIQMSAFLEDIGWSVLPDSEYPDDEYRVRLDEDLNKSNAFIQLLGPYPWKRGAFDRLQNEAAVSLQLRRFRYRSSDIDLETVDTAHREFLTAADVIQSGFEDFKSFLEKELKILQQQLEQPARQLGNDDNPPLVRVVIRSPNPDPLWEKVFHWIYDQEHILPYQLGNDETLEEKHLASPCQGFLVVCDSSALEDGPHSPRKDMEQCRQIQLKEKNAARRPPVGLVYWPPPDASWAKLLRSTPLKLYRILGDEPDNLGEFFAEVRKASQ
jgi:hypothetical protein